MTAGSSRGGRAAAGPIAPAPYGAPGGVVNHGSTDPSTELSTDLERRAGFLWDRYAYPSWLRQHSLVVGRVALVLALQRPGEVDADVVALAGYLHDIGRSSLVAGDRREHNELSALILTAEGMAECVELARRHPVYAVLDPRTAPRTLAERLVYYADRRGGLAVLPIDDRITETALRYPVHAEAIERARPLAHAIERMVYEGLSSSPADLAAQVRQLT